MAKPIKRGNRWHIQVYKKGVRKTATFDTKREANNWARDTEVTLLHSDTLERAVEKYIRDECPKHKGEKWERLRLNKLARDLPNKRLSELTSSDLATYRDNRLKTASAGTVRREFTLLNQLFNTALKEWGWLTANPLEKVKKPPQPRPRRRGVTQEETKRVLKALGYMEEITPIRQRHFTAVAFLFALETAMRAGEIVGLTWDRVFLKKRFVRLIETKNGDSRDVPLSPRAIELIKIIKPKKTEKEDFCFPLTSGALSTHFRSAKHEAGLPDLRFHDSRSEALTRLSKKLDVLQLARMVGHNDPRSLMIYYSESASDLAKML